MADEPAAAADAGGRALDAGDLDEAERSLRLAVELNPEDKASWYNLALVHKFRRDWEAAVADGLRAVPEGGSGSDGSGPDPAWWNLGIAATALRDWPLARRAWRGYGVELPDGEGEIDADLGVTPLRINPDGAAEVVWGRRLDPARALLLSVPTPESGRRWGDIVLHDGVPRGERRVGRRDYPVFDELELWRRSSTPTLTAQVTAATEADVDALITAVEDAGGGAEDWSTMRLICAECSLGNAGHTHEHDDAWQPVRTVGVAMPTPLAEGLLARWQESAPESRAWTGLTEAP